MASYSGHDSCTLEQLHVFHEHGFSVPHLQQIICNTSSGAVGVFSGNIGEISTHSLSLSPSQTEMIFRLVFRCNIIWEVFCHGLLHIVQ